jgi:hypothetical protein
MAHIYVYSGAVGSANGTSWTNAYTTLGAAATASAGGDDIWVASDHAESSGSTTTIIFTLATNNPQKIYSVNRAGSVPPVPADLLAGASITTTGAGGININSAIYVWGLTFNCGSGANNATLTIQGTSSVKCIYENCTFKILATGVASRIIPTSSTSTNTELINCSMQFSNISQGLTNSGYFVWRSGTSGFALQGSTFPTTLGVAGSATAYSVYSGLDFSNYSGNLFNAVARGGKVINCKLHASTVLVNGSVGPSYGTSHMIINSNSGSVLQRNEIVDYEGVLTTETTIVRTAGASDGSTDYSWKFVTNANNKLAQPFSSFEGAIWNESTGSSKTLTFHCVTDNVTLTNADIWVQAEYLDSNTSPKTSPISSRVATLVTTPANLTSDSGTGWTTTGLTTPNKQKFSVTFTPNMAGPVRWKVYVSKASSTIYVCPKPDLT